MQQVKILLKKCFVFHELMYSLMMDQYGPKHEGANGFKNIVLNDMTVVFVGCNFVNRAIPRVMNSMTKEQLGNFVMLQECVSCR